MWPVLDPVITIMANDCSTVLRLETNSESELTQQQGLSLEDWKFGLPQLAGMAPTNPLFSHPSRTTQKSHLCCPLPPVAVREH